MVYTKSRGILISEVMIIAGIMGTLSAMVLPMYHGFQKQVKENVYKSDIISLHKGWQTFAISSDNFCENNEGMYASIHNIGLRTLLVSRFYGTDVTVASCSDSSKTALDSCTGEWDHDSDSSTPDVNRIWSPVMKANHPPNFIGFGWKSNACASRSVLIGKASDTDSSDAIGIGASSRRSPIDYSVPCSLYPDAYTMGVGGYIGGRSYVAFTIENKGSEMFRKEFFHKPTMAELTYACQ